MQSAKNSTGRKKMGMSDREGCEAIGEAIADWHQLMPHSDKKIVARRQNTGSGAWPLMDMYAIRYAERYAQQNPDLTLEFTSRNGMAMATLRRL